MGANPVGHFVVFRAALASNIVNTKDVSAVPNVALTLIRWRLAV
jgi:hypothetical protein